MAQAPNANSGEAPPPPADFFHQYLQRTIAMLGRDAVDTLRTKTIAVSGCGGHGGAAAITLARMGVAGFNLADPNPFDEPDINRQWGASLATLGRNKARVYAEILRSINPECRIRVFEDGVTTANVPDFLEGADLLVDCLDIAVPGALRAQLFRAARARGIHASTGANLGFGGMVAGASADGWPLEILGGIEDDAIAGAPLPAPLYDIFVPEYLRLVEESLIRQRVPSIAVAPVLLGALLSVEAVAALLGGVIPGWRPPVCLPQVLLVDLLRMSYRVVHLDDLAAPPAVAAVPVAPAAVQPVAASALIRRSQLTQVGYNTNLLPDAAVEVDLITDSWSEIPFPTEQPDPADRAFGAPQEVLRGLYGYTYVMPVFRGRFAEALLGKSLGFAGAGIAVANGLFPTTRFHLESNGLRVLELPCPEASDARSPFGFKGNLDLRALDDLLAGPDGPAVRVVYIELCANALGGQPVALGHLRAVRERLAGRGISLALDATRAFENAVLLQQREEGLRDKSLVAIVRDLCACSDCCAASCTKDFKTPLGGFTATRSAAHATGLRDLALACGDGLSGATKAVLGRSLAHHAAWVERCRDRVGQAQRLWGQLRGLGVPVVGPAGGHGVFVDAKALLPHLAPDQYPAQALANALYLRAGVRGAVNFQTPQQARTGVQWLRLAVPIARYTDAQLAVIGEGFEGLMAEVGSIRGLTMTYSPPGAMGEFAASYQSSSAAQ